VLSCVAGVGAALCCCTGYGMGMAGRSSQSSSELQSEVSRLSVRETPVWVGLITLPAILVAPLAITAVVLLLVPPSNRFFRPGAVPVQDPSGGYYVYPAQWAGGQLGGPPSGAPPANPPANLPEPPANLPEPPANPPGGPDHPPGGPEHPPDKSPRG
jgi:hypothetical protein